MTYQEDKANEMRLKLFHRMSWVFVTTTIRRAQICRLKINISITCSIKNKLLE